MHKKNTLYGILTILFANPAYAALDCKIQPTCTQLGYSKNDVPGCTDYILCPFDTNYKACVKETTKYESCEDAGYFSNNTNRRCSGTTSIYLSDGKTATCFTSCSCTNDYIEDSNGECSIRAYKSCEAAGWHSSIPANSHCSESMSIYLTNGTQTTCYSGCSCLDGYIEDADGNCIKDTPTYKSCEDAGYFTSNQNRNCTGPNIEIQLTTGSTVSCYTSCSCINGYIEDSDGECSIKAYASCEDAGYATTPAQGLNCSSTTNIYLTSGKTQKCCISYTCQTGHYGYVDVGNGCHAITGLMQDCDNEMQNCEEANRDGYQDINCASNYGHCFQEACSALCETIYTDVDDVETCANKCAKDRPYA